MKTCQFCGYQNEDELPFCFECGMELSPPEAAAPATSTNSSEPLAIVASFGDTARASLLQARLEQAGIEACVPEEFGPSPFGNLIPLAHITVRVAEKDLAAARQVLANAA